MWSSFSFLRAHPVPLQIRGAPAIASLASLGIASELLTLLSGKSSPAFPAESLASATELLALLLKQTAYLLTSRPTAVNLLEALSRIESAAKEATEAGATGEQLARKVVDVAVGVWDEDRERNVAIGDNGASWILEKLEREGTIEKGEKVTVLTVSALLRCISIAEADLCCISRSAIPVRSLPRFVLASFAALAPAHLHLSTTGLRNRSRCHHLAAPYGTPLARLLRSDGPLPAGSSVNQHGARFPGHRKHDGVRYCHRSSHRREEGPPLCRWSRPVSSLTAASSLRRAPS